MNWVSTAEIVQVIEHRENVREYIVRLEKERKYPPGSFVQLSLELVTASDIWPESRTFSIASFKEGSMRLIIEKVGSYTSRIFDELQVGRQCTIKYPYGDLFRAGTSDEKHLFLAGGLGITPFIGLAEYFHGMGKIENVALLYSARNAGDLIHLEHLNNLFGERLKIFITRESDHQYSSRRIDIRDIQEQAALGDHVYVCGSRSFTDDMLSILRKNNFTNIHTDEWD